jgi:hypothetical protein
MGEVPVSQMIEMLWEAMRNGPPNDPQWTEHVPDKVYRLAARLDLLSLPEHEAAEAIARLSRADLRRDGYATTTLASWLERHGLALQD